MFTETRAICCVEMCNEVTHRKGKIFCTHHYIQELEAKLEWARDKIYDLEKQTITELEETLKLATYSLEKIVDRYFDLPPDKRFDKTAKESAESLTARQALKIIKAAR